MRLLDIVPVEEYVTVHTAVCQEAMKFVVRWNGTLQGSGVTLHLSVRARCRLVCGWHTAVWQLIIGKRADGIVLREIDWLRNGGSKAERRSRSVRRRRRIPDWTAVRALLGAAGDGPVRRTATKTK